MKQLSIDDIRAWDPCYDPIKYLPEDWKGTVVDMLNLDEIPFQDRLWCVLRTELLSDRVMRLFAVWSYRQTLAWVPNPDPRSLEAALVAERFANGEASQTELEAARSAAWSAAESAGSAARSAARSAAWSAAESAAESAGSAARSAAWSAAESAESAAWSAARSAAWSSQKNKLIEMILKENKE